MDIKRCPEVTAGIAGGVVAGLAGGVAAGTGVFRYLQLWQFGLLTAITGIVVGFVVLVILDPPAGGAHRD